MFWPILILMMGVALFVFIWVITYLDEQENLRRENRRAEEPDYGKQLRDMIRSKLVSWQRESVFDSWADYTVKCWQDEKNGSI
jgi:hypothetical protein